MARVSRIQAVMTLSWDVLATLTPVDYLALPRRARHLVGVPVGAVPRARVPPRPQGPKLPRLSCEGSEERARLSAALAEPSLWDEANAALERAGFDLGDRSSAAIAAAWLEVYRDTERWFDLYQLAEKLVDIDDALAGWRHKHVLTVERIIGNKPGTGGSAGAAYLRATLDKRAFPELWSLRTESCELQAAVLAEPRRGDPERLHLAAHSHHLWPDASFDGQVECWDDAARARRPQVGQGDGRGVARGAGPCRGRAGQRRSVRDRLCGQHP